MRPIPTLLAAALLLPGLAACAPDGSPVEAVASERSATVAEGPVVTIPSLSELPDDAAPATTSTVARPVAERVETLVEPAAPRPSTVAVVGDSLTRSAEEEISASLAAGGLEVLTVDGLESRRMARGGSALPPGTDAIDAILEVAEPELWVIALGTNDVASVGSADGFRDEMRQVLSRLPADAPVVWVDLWIRDRAPSIREANRLIRQELRGRAGGAAVVDWYSHGQDEGVITSDGVHLTDAGQQLFADSILVAIDELFDA